MLCKSQCLQTALNYFNILSVCASKKVTEGTCYTSLSRYRWKGENVATSEVADILTMSNCISEANVYGVNVEGKNCDVL